MKQIFLYTTFYIFTSFLFTCPTFLFAEEDKPKITQHEINEALYMLGGKENLMKGVKELAEKKYYLANQIILWERSPKVEKYSDLDNKKMILDLEVNCSHSSSVYFCLKLPISLI